MFPFLNMLLSIPMVLQVFNHRQVCLVSVYCAGCSGSIPFWNNTQGREIVEEKMLPLLYNICQMVGALQRLGQGRPIVDPGHTKKL